MTTLEKIKEMVQTANTTYDVLTIKMVEEVMPLVIEKLNKDFKTFGEYAVTYNRPSSEYPEVFYTLVYAQIRPVIYEYLDKNHKEAWFKDMYLHPTELKKLMDAEDKVNKNPISDIL